MTKPVTSVDSLIDGFPLQPIKIRGLPTYETLRKLKQDLQRNSASVSCALGGGRHGYLGLILSANAYATKVGTTAAGVAQPFITPIFPGDQPIFTGVTAEAKKEELRVFDYQTYAWEMYENVHAALRKQLVEAVEDTYISPLMDQVTGYNNVSVNDILSHLFSEYGDVGPTEIHENNKRFDEPWDGAEPFENIIKRIDECVEYAANGLKPYSAEQIVGKCERLVLETGLFNDTLEKWDARPTIEQTYANFKEQILAAQRVHRKHSGTAKQSGYGLAIQHMTQVTEGVANAVSAVHEKAAASEAKTLAAMGRMEAEMVAMRKTMTEMAARYNAPGQPPPAAAPLEPAAARQPRTKRVPKDDGGYCWTHGYHVTTNHTSANCKWPKEGHCIAATRENNMGGCQRGKPE
jgi:uncharacterized phage-associated protein